MKDKKTINKSNKRFRKHSKDSFVSDIEINQDI